MTWDETERRACEYGMKFINWAIDSGVSRENIIDFIANDDRNYPYTVRDVLLENLKYRVIHQGVEDEG
jgi:hypothetical protein